MFNQALLAFASVHPNDCNVVKIGNIVILKTDSNLQHEK